MSDKERYEIAKAFIDEQLKTMEKNGLQLTKISQHEYEAMVKRIAQTVSGPRDAKKAAASSGTL